MPELPEVECVARRLAPRLRGRRLVGVELRDERLGRVDACGVVGCEVEGVRRVGKQVAIRFRGRERTVLLCHLRMTGRLVWIADGETAPETRHLRVRLRFGGGELWFVDPRRFGTLRFVAGGEAVCAAGLEPMSRGCTVERLAGLLAGSRQELKPWLLRQDRVVGIGNIYASEIAFRARLHPRRLAGSLGPGEIRRLHGAIRGVLRRAIRWGGTTFSDFADPRGRAGGFGARLAVYGRGGCRCRRCGSVIVRSVQQQRSTYHCPGCQPLRPSGTDAARGSAARQRGGVGDG